MDTKAKEALKALLECINNKEFSSKELNWISSLIDNKLTLQEFEELDKEKYKSDFSIQIDMHKNWAKYYNENLGLTE